ncbi:hypothetical protein ABK040_015508 [Willaertia magna]
MSQLKKRKIDDSFIFIDNLSLRFIFTFSSIIDVITSFQFVNKQWYNIYISKEFQKCYYGNIFQLNNIEELNNLENLLKELHEVINDTLDYKDLFNLDVVPSNFEHLFKYWCKLQFYSYYNKNYLLHEKLSNNLLNKDYVKYKENIKLLDELINLEKGKFYLFERLNYYNKNGYLYCTNMEDIEPNNNILRPDMNKLFKLFNLSKLSFNHIYPLTYYFINDDDCIHTDTVLVLFLDNGIPLLISSYFLYKKEDETFEIFISICGKVLFIIVNEDTLKVELNLVNALVDKIFKVNKEELQNLIIKKYKYKLDEETKDLYESTLQSFIVGYLFYLFKVFHKKVYKNDTGVRVMESVYEVLKITKILYRFPDEEENE